MKKLLFLLTLLPSLAWSAPAVTSMARNNTNGLLAGALVHGTTMTITGTGFGLVQGLGTVDIATSPFSGSGYTTQGISSWSNTSIDIAISTGGFSHGDRKYLSVQDTNGSRSVGFPVYIQASTPTISGYDGVLVHGSTIAVTGSKFGTRSDYHADSDKLAKMWSDWNNGSLITTAYGTFSTFNFGSHLALGSDSPRTTITGDNYYKRTSASELGYLNIQGGNNEEYYMACWFKTTLTSYGSGGQFKMIRLYASGDADGDGTNENFYTNVDPSNGFYQNFEFLNPVITATSESQWNANDPGAAPSGWHYSEFYMKRASGNGVRDGECWAKWDGVTAFDWWHNFQIYDPSADGAGEFDNDGETLSGIWTVGNFAKAFLPAGSYIAFDDLVLDHSLARVVIADASTWTASTDFEYQPVSGWDDDTITLTVNRGAFGATDTAYLYVIDKYGFVNPTGTSVTFGQSGGQGTPTDPDDPPAPPDPPEGGPSDPTTSTPSVIRSLTVTNATLNTTH